VNPGPRSRATAASTAGDRPVASRRVAAPSPPQTSVTSAYSPCCECNPVSDLVGQSVECFLVTTLFSQYRGDFDQRSLVTLCSVREDHSEPPEGWTLRPANGHLALTQENGPRPLAHLVKSLLGLDLNRSSETLLSDPGKVGALHPQLLPGGGYREETSTVVIDGQVQEALGNLLRLCSQTFVSYKFH